MVTADKDGWVYVVITSEFLGLTVLAMLPEGGKFFWDDAPPKGGRPPSSIELMQSIDFLYRLANSYDISDSSMQSAMKALESYL